MHAPRANSLLAGPARSAVPNPGGTGYTLFPAHPLDPASTPRSPSPSFRRIPSSLFLLHLLLLLYLLPLLLFALLLALLRRLPLFRAAHSGSFVSLSHLRCTKLQFLAISLAPNGDPSRSSPPTRRVASPHHRFPLPSPLCTEPPTSYATPSPPRCTTCSSALPPPCSDDALSRARLSSTYVPVALSRSPALSTPPAIVGARRAEARRQAPRVRSSQLRLRSVGSEGRPEESVSMRRAALPASCM